MQSNHYTEFLFYPGEKGFEPLNVGSKFRCLTTWLHPNDLCCFVVLRSKTKGFKQKKANKGFDPLDPINDSFSAKPLLDPKDRINDCGRHNIGFASFCFTE